MAKNITKINQLLLIVIEMEREEILQWYRLEKYRNSIKKVFTEYHE